MQHAILLWLDDERDPADPLWHGWFPIECPTVVWVRTVGQFRSWITAHGLPTAVCLDHDLGEGPSGLDAAKWLAEYCLAAKAPLPFWNVHSANPIGRENIRAVLRSFERIARDFG